MIEHGEIDVLNFRVDRIAEHQQHENRHREDDDQRPKIAPDVDELFADDGDDSGHGCNL